jgi:murein endopeptidase
MVHTLAAEPRSGSLLIEAPAPRRAPAVPRNCAWFNPQAACWAQHRAAVVRALGLSTPRPSRARLARTVELWQSGQGLTVDGVMGPRTWQRLWSVLGVVPVPSVTTQLPPDGPGYYAYARRRPHHRFGRPETIGALQTIAAGWAQAHPNGPRIGIGDISLRGGGPIWGHCSHQCGIDVDIYPMRSDGQERGVRLGTAAYSQALTQELVSRIRGNGVLAVQFVLFNDATVKGVKPWPNHDDHLHVRFRPPGAGTPEAPDPEVEAIVEALGEAEAKARAKAKARRPRPRPHPPFPQAVIDRVLQAYRDNHAAGVKDRVDRASCIVMLNIGLGHLLGLRMKDHPARSTLDDKPVKSRTVQMGDLTTWSVKHAMEQLQRRGLATGPVKVDFLDKRGRKAGTLAPVRMNGSVARAVLRRTGAAKGWYAFGLSVMDSQHSVLLLVHRGAGGVRIFWMDQFSDGLSVNVTTTLDDHITKKTISMWNNVYAKKKKGYNTVARLWRLRNPSP